LIGFDGEFLRRTIACGGEYLPYTPVSKNKALYVLWDTQYWDGFLLFLRFGAFA
jgi:hypothetical protein